MLKGINMTKAGFFTSYKKQMYTEYEGDKINPNYQIIGLEVIDNIEQVDSTLLLRLNRELPLDYIIEITSKPFVNFGPYLKVGNEYSYAFTVVPNTLYTFVVNIYDNNRVPIARKSIQFFKRVLELSEIIGSVVIEGLYLNSQSDLNLLPLRYHTINSFGSHQCNNAKFSIFANDVYIGDINLNNSGIGQSAPYDDELNTPLALTESEVWTGDSLSRYSRIDITKQQAEQIIQNSNSSVINFKITPQASSPHSDITWLRISRKIDNNLQIVVDLLATLNTNYPVDVQGN